ncbi:MAG: SDR family NAD(P)-dependent oxidoreductase [Fimbriimonas sp.]
MFSLVGKHAVISGGASGIGESIARAFVEAGARVTILDRDQAQGTSVAVSVGAQFVACDVADLDSCVAAGTAAGEAEILVNCAGVGHVGNVLTTTDAELDRLIGVNVKGVLHLTQQFLPAMVSRGAGSVVNIASIGGIVGIRDRLGYCATKFAVVGITKCCALDYAETGVRFNCICPGRVETPFVQARLAEYPDPEAARREMSATQAIGRMGTPHEIAAAALYLAADESAFVTGSSLIIDGGWTAGK